ncbi:MAG: DUF5993 family protein [Hyphomicrobiales bacterium]
MISLIFVFFSATMVLSYIGLQKTAYALFGVSIVISAYWLKFHATSQLTIQL